MWIVTAKIPKKKLLCLAAGAVLLLAALFWAGRQGGSLAASALFRQEKNGESSEARLAYLRSFGWSVAETPLSVEELLIPRELDAQYAQYLALQEEQGFRLERYRGKRVKRYTYEITNYPTGESGVQAGLLVYQGKIIGADVMSSQLNGFIHGLTMPAAPIPSPGAVPGP